MPVGPFDLDRLSLSLQLGSHEWGQIPEAGQTEYS